MVPPTVVRRIKGDLGSLQLWVEGCDSYKRLQPKVPQTRQFSRRISRMKMFDNLIFNDDRNTGNFILDESEHHSLQSVGTCLTPRGASCGG